MDHTTNHIQGLANNGQEMDFHIFGVSHVFLSVCIIAPWD